MMITWVGTFIIRLLEGISLNSQTASKLYVLTHSRLASAYIYPFLCFHKKNLRVYASLSNKTHLLLNLIVIPISCETWQLLHEYDRTSCVCQDIKPCVCVRT